MKILLLKPSSLGDVIHALPVARLLKRHFPEAEIHWWINRDLMPLLEGDPDLAKLIPFDRKLWGRPEGWPLAVREIRGLRQARYDWVVDLQSLARTALVGWLARGTFTIGLEDRREGAPLFYDVAVPRPTPSTHAVDWYLEVLRHLKIPVDFNFEWIPARPQVAARVAGLCPDPGARWIAFQPGARWENKRWPVTHFADLARQLLKADPELRIAVLGGADDRVLGRTIAEVDQVRILDLTGRLSLPEMIEWLRLSALMVTNDTGPMHVAAALKKPVVALFGPTAPARTGPYGRQHTVLQVALPCVPCLKAECHFEEPLACLRQVTPRQALETVQEQLKRIPTDPCSAASTA